MTNGLHSPDLVHLKPVIEALALETGLPVDAIEAVYCEEHSKLDARAKIKTFVPLITRRRVRAILKKQKAAA